MARISQELSHLRDSVGTPRKVKTSELEPRRQLLVLIIQSFDLGELMELCFNLGVMWDRLEGDTIQAKTMSLIEHMARREQTYMLIGECQKARPAIDWPML